MLVTLTNDLRTIEIGDWIEEELSMSKGVLQADEAALALDHLDDAKKLCHKCLDWADNPSWIRQCDHVFCNECLKNEISQQKREDKGVQSMPRPPNHRY